MIRKKPMPSSLEQEFKKNGLEPILEKEGNGNIMDELLQFEIKVLKID